MKMRSFHGPKPVVAGAILGLLIDATHGLYRATQVDTNAPLFLFEAARRWFIGMITMIVLVCIFGRISDVPDGTPPLGHFLSWSKTLQRMAIAIPLSVVILAFYFSTTGAQSHPASAGPTGIACVLAAIVASIFLTNVLAAIYGLKPRTTAQHAEWRTARTNFFANFRRAPARESLPKRNDLDEFCKQADARRQVAESKAQLDVADQRYLDDLATQQQQAAHNAAAGERRSGSDQRSSTTPDYLDAQGRLITPRELVNGDDLPPIA